MPSKSAKQARLMAAVAHNAKFAAKVGIPQSVGREFHAADRAKGRYAGGGKVKTVQDLRTALENWKVNKLPQEGFFSTLDELIANAPQESMPAFQWQKYLQPGRELTREGVKFPLKKEEIGYGQLDMLADPLMANIRGLPAELLEKGPDTLLTKDQVRQYVRESRPNLTSVVNAEFMAPLGRARTDAEALRPMQSFAERRGLRHPQDVGQYDNVAPEHVPGFSMSQPKYDWAGLRHDPGVPNSYEEAITIAPEMGSAPSHFTSGDVSWSRTTRHRIPHQPDSPLVGYKNDLPTLRLIEEIQSDRHSQAGVKVFDPSEENHAEWQRLVKELDAKYPDQAWSVVHRPGDLGHINIDDPLIQQLQDNLERSWVRRGYRTPDLSQELHRLEMQLVELKTRSNKRQAQIEDEMGPVPQGVNPAARRQQSLAHEEVSRLRNQADQMERRINEIRAMPPDAPFKDPRDYATHEVRKQLLNATRDEDQYLGLTRGQDQIDRYEAGMGDQESRGMTEMYDKLYPSVLRKEAGRYGGKPTTVDLQTVKSKDIRPGAFADVGAETMDDFTERTADYEQGEFHGGTSSNIEMMEELLGDFEQALTADPTYSDREAAGKLLDEIGDKIERGNRRMETIPEDTEEFHEIPEIFGQGGAQHLLERWYNDHWGYLKKAQVEKSTKQFPAAELDGDTRKRIRRIGVPIFSAAGAAALGYDISSDDQGDQPVFAEGGPVSFGPDTKWSDSSDDAALAAYAALDAAQASEQAGLLFKDRASGKYAYTPATPGRRDDFTVRASYDPAVLDLIASYHTHPDGPDSHVFSTHDVDTARTLQLLSYIMDKAGKVHRFDPKTSRVRQSGERRLGNQRLQTALGDLVIPKGTAVAQQAPYAKGGGVSKPKKTLDYWRAVADSMGNAVPFTSDDTRKRLSDLMARPLSGLASQVLTRDPATGELYPGGRPGLVDEFKALPTLYEDATGFMMNNMGGRDFAQGMSGADPETMDLTQKLLFSAPEFAHQAQADTESNYRAARQGMGLDEPHGFGENILEAGGVMAGQLPVPGSIARRLKALSESRPALNAARKVVGPAVEWLSPTIDPKPGNYLKGALFGGTLGGASDKVTDYLDEKQQQQFIREAISQVLAEGGDTDEQLDAAVDEAADKQGYAEGGKVSKARQALKLLREQLKVIDISPDRMYSIGRPREEVLYAINEGVRVGKLTPDEAAAFKQQMSSGDENMMANTLLALQDKLHPAPPVLGGPGPIPAERFAPLPHESLDQDLGTQPITRPLHYNQYVKSDMPMRGTMSDEDFQAILRGEPIKKADGGPIVTGPVDYEHYGETGPEHLFFGDRRMPALPEGWKPAIQATPHPVSSSGGSTAGSIASGLGTVLALGRDARQAGNLYGSARDLYNRIFGNTPNQAQGISDQGAGDFSGTNADIASDLSNLPIPELAGAAGAGAAGLGALGAAATPAGTVTITEGGLAGLGALGGEAGAAGATGAGAAGAGAGGAGALGSSGALGGGASADAIGGAAAGTSGLGLAAGLGVAALPLAIMLGGGFANNRTERNQLALNQSGLQQTQLAGGQRVLIRPDGTFMPFNDNVMNDIRERWGVLPENEFWDWVNSQQGVEGQINRIPTRVRNQPLTASSRSALEEAGLFDGNPGVNAKAGRRQKD